MRKPDKLLSVFLAVLLFFTMRITASAAGGSTTLTVTIPCTVTVQAGDHGKVTVNSTDYIGNGTFTAEGGEVFTYIFTPDVLYQVERVFYNGEDVSEELNGNTYTAPALEGNAIISVSFRLSENSETGTCVVIFDTNGHGTAAASQIVTVGSSAAEPAAPTADGWEFGGWYKDRLCTETQKYDFNTPVMANLVLYARWRAVNPTAPIKPGNPFTGDHTHLLLWAILLIAASAIFTQTAVYRRKKSN